jgi:hypothetical protein
MLVIVTLIVFLMRIRYRWCYMKISVNVEDVIETEESKKELERIKQIIYETRERTSGSE